MRYPEKRVWLNDADPVITGVWRYLIAVKESEIAQLPLLFESVDDLQYLPQEARWLIGFWLNKGCSAPRKTPSAWMRAGTNSTGFWGETIRARIAAQLFAIRHWRVTEGSYESLPDLAATWFVDPPYQKAGVHYKKKLTDFAALGIWCRARQGQVMVCENAGADWLPFRPFRTIQANHSKTGGKQSVEVIWMND